MKRGNMILFLVIVSVSLISATQTGYGECELECGVCESCEWVGSDSAYYPSEGFTTIKPQLFLDILNFLILTDQAGLGSSAKTFVGIVSYNKGKVVDDCGGVGDGVKCRCDGSIVKQSYISDDGEITPEEITKATVQIIVTENPEGRTLLNHGTGTIIELRNDKALVLTCGHIFRMWTGGKIVADWQGNSDEEQIPVRLIDSDLISKFDEEAKKVESEGNDVALVEIEIPEEMDVNVVRIAPKEYKIEEEDIVHTAGCSFGKPCTVCYDESVISVNRFLDSSNFQVSGDCVSGRSGGGVFTKDGLVIGTCSGQVGGSTTLGDYSHLTNIHKILDDNGYSYVYDSSASRECVCEDGECIGKRSKKELVETPEEPKTPQEPEIREPEPPSKKLPLKPACVPIKYTLKYYGDVGFSTDIDLEKVSDQKAQKILDDNPNDDLVPVLDSPTYILMRDGEVVMTNYKYYKKEVYYDVEDIKSKIKESRAKTYIFFP